MLRIPEILISSNIVPMSFQGVVCGLSDSVTRSAEVNSWFEELPPGDTTKNVPGFIPSFDFSRYGCVYAPYKMAS